jgi:protein TonB
MNTLNSQADVEGDTGPSLLAVLTLVLWLLALIVGAIGLLWTGSPGLVSQAATPEPVVAELVNPDPAPIQEQLADASAEPVDSALSTTDSPSPPPVASPLALAAAPSALIAFAVPVDGPVRIVSAMQAAPAPKMAATPAPVVVQHLVFGQGEGRQPAPAYPPQAVIERQEGVVIVRFTVGEDGHVITAELSAPSRWPLLNQAALDVVRSQWRLSPGAVRTEDVRIRFQLN